MDKGVYREKLKSTSFDESEKNLEYSRPEPPRRTMSQTDPVGVDLMFWIILSLSQVVGIAAVALVIYWCTLYGGFAWHSSAEQQFFYHPLLMVLGLIFFYGEAILAYRALHFLPKWLLKIVHAALHLFALVSSSVGLAAVFENHRRTNKADLYSLHSWVGIATFGFFCLQYIGGFVAFLFPGLPLTLRAKAMPFHTFFGTGIFIMAVATAGMGLTERLIWTTGYTSTRYVKAGVVGNLIGLLLTVFAFLVVYLTSRNQYKRKPLVTESFAPTN